MEENIRKKISPLYSPLLTKPSLPFNSTVIIKRLILSTYVYICIWNRFYLKTVYIFVIILIFDFCTFKVILVLKEDKKNVEVLKERNKEMDD